jgi:hypothetical protein
MAGIRSDKRTGFGPVFVTAGTYILTIRRLNAGPSRPRMPGPRNGSAGLLVCIPGRNI